MDAAIGDWVRSYHAGVWQVLRAVPEHFEPRFSLHDVKQLYEGPLFILKRLVNDKWKPAFEIESVHGSLLRRLTKADAKRLDAFIGANGPVLEAFSTFERPLRGLLNVGFALKRKSDVSKLRKEVAAALGELSAGVTADDVLKAIASTTFADCCGESPRSATLQFVNYNCEIRDRELIYREIVELKF
ncbi:MAG TPA: hypothetical protein VGE52_11075 [Pirellulales bacterium]